MIASKPLRYVTIVGGVVLAWGFHAAVHARPQATPATPVTAPAPAPAAQRPDEGPVRGANGEVIGFTKLAEIPGRYQI